MRRMRAFAAALILILIAGACACAEAMPTGLENLTVQGERIVGRMDTNYGYQLSVDMPVPQDRSGRVKQLQMESVSMTQEDAKKLLQGYQFSGAAGDKWTYLGADGTETTFHFQEKEMKYAVPRWNIKYCPLETEGAAEALSAAEDTVRKIMDALNVPYEYPFYCIADAFATLDTQSKPLGLKNGRDVAEYLLSGQVRGGDELYRYYSDVFKAFDDDYVFVFVRLQEDGIPFAYGSVRSRDAQENDMPAGNGTFVQFQLTSSGQVTYAEAANLQTVAGEAAETRPILSWEECLGQLCAASQGTLKDLRAAKLTRAELCYAIDSSHAAYPVWEFTIEIDYGKNEFPYEVYPHPFYVDAITGECL